MAQQGRAPPQPLPRSRSGKVQLSAPQRPRLSQSVTAGRLPGCEDRGEAGGGLPAPYGGANGQQIQVSALRLPKAQPDAWQGRNSGGQGAATPPEQHPAPPEQPEPTAAASAFASPPDPPQSPLDKEGSAGYGGHTPRGGRQRRASIAVLPTDSPPRSPRLCAPSPTASTGEGSRSPSSARGLAQRRRSLTAAGNQGPQRRSMPSLDRTKVMSADQLVSQEEAAQLAAQAAQSSPHMHGQSQSFILKTRASPRSGSGSPASPERLKLGAMPSQPPPQPPPSALSGALPAHPPPQPPVPSVPAQPARTHMRWKKGKFIGAGAFGKVCIGLCQDTGQLMAVKTIQVELKDPHVKQHLAALQAEIRVMKQLQHPNIVRYLCTERQGNSVNIFMEYVPGGSIASLLRQFGRLNEPTAAVYMDQILLALAHLHGHGVVHRDIKGANVLVSVNGAVKVSDFGTAVYLDDIRKAGASSPSAGTPFWMAPEVITDSGYGWQCDIWSTGCTMVEMLTARQPFAHISDNALVCMTFIGSGHKPISYPAELIDRLTEECQDLLGQCLNRVAADRPSAHELLQHPLFTIHVEEEPPEEDAPDQAQDMQSQSSSSGSSHSSPGAAVLLYDQGPVRSPCERHSTASANTHTSFAVPNMLAEKDPEAASRDPDAQPGVPRGGGSRAGSRTTTASLPLAQALTDLTAGGFVPSSTLPPEPPSPVSRHHPSSRLSTGAPTPIGAAAALSNVRPASDAALSVGRASELSGGPTGARCYATGSAQESRLASGFGLGTPPRSGLAAQRTQSRPKDNAFPARAATSDSQSNRPRDNSFPPRGPPRVPGALVNQRRRRSHTSDPDGNQDALTVGHSDSRQRIHLLLQQSCLELLSGDPFRDSAPDPSQHTQSPAPTSPITIDAQPLGLTANYSVPMSHISPTVKAYSRDELVLALAQKIEAEGQGEVACIDSAPPEGVGQRYTAYATTSRGVWSGDQHGDDQDTDRSDNLQASQVAQIPGHAAGGAGGLCHFTPRARRILHIALVAGLIAAIAGLTVALTTR
eukprot:TRINITY_DN13151_c0_g1_i1.p1 TRINITY_DN13151_c0_g1~~TRINITY_DN13151_c0_g1_i1.p1  ORF type:complete len:1091 (+),score=174.77 TRINITY_DN13151_c0_g1_i1:156-3275(+)